MIRWLRLPLLGWTELLKTTWGYDRHEASPWRSALLPSLLALLTLGSFYWGVPEPGKQSHPSILLFGLAAGLWLRRHRDVGEMSARWAPVCLGVAVHAIGWSGISAYAHGLSWLEVFALPMRCAWTLLAAGAVAYGGALVGMLILYAAWVVRFCVGWAIAIAKVFSVKMVLGLGMPPWVDQVGDALSDLGLGLAALGLVWLLVAVGDEDLRQGEAPEPLSLLRKLVSRE